MNNPTDHQCPAQAIINAVFGYEPDNVPKEIADEIKACEKCFVSYYGDHLTEKSLNAHLDNFTIEEDFHFGHCPECAKKYYALHPRPNKMGRSSRAYLSRITTP